jgi:hypothetical protein
MKTISTQAGPPDPGGVITSVSVRILSERLRELDINSNGLPSHVTAHLRVIVDAEVAAIQRALAAEVAALHHKADERIRRQAARVITYKSIGKAFGAATTTKAAPADSTATGGAAK